jgi:hypothetical protein
MEDRRDVIQSREQMKQKIRSLVEDMLRRFPQPVLAKIAFSIQYWNDDDCPQTELCIPAPPRTNETTAIQERGAGEDDSGAQRLLKWRGKVRSSLEEKSKELLLEVINH